ncbi:MAG TPA: PLD nuclease N-terminal domain-containing protein [Anaerolineaceae bacterium]|jgi:drug/metabolite transporter (DMT)-like permease|nr:PLD nuclease N-terminal domain-containing protein [Anaerolineaceae bacterium]HQF46670.1 PLD nuclease N-terminal domain-containing protein [Anaerolineaceae bacterium]HQH36542.1 PLD nuclease N-terminal domain-containing protein [Anaerolineaceae bacterium]HQJ04674.1 PLD nuclease N-terminal domain-containing protein [Anaerolineaceae bacterium]
MDIIQQYLPYLIPLIVIQLGLLVFALLDLLKRERTRGPKWMWIIIIIFVNIFGPVAYLLFGREES